MEFESYASFDLDTTNLLLLYYYKFTTMLSHLDESDALLCSCKGRINVGMLRPGKEPVLQVPQETVQGRRIEIKNRTTAG